MDIKIQEDSRTLREFYADPGLRHQVHYAFAHRFLPQYVQQSPFAFFSYLYDRELPSEVAFPTRFLQSRWSVIFEPSAGLTQQQGNPLAGGMVFRRVRDLTMSIQELDGRASALIQMPTPEQPPQAYFVCVVLQAAASQAGSWPRDVEARVFTLESEADEPVGGRTGLVCEWTRDGTHRNFGMSVPAGREAFLRAVSGLVQAPGTPAPFGYTPARDGVPPVITARTEAVSSSRPPRGPVPESQKPWWKIW